MTRKHYELIAAAIKRQIDASGRFPELRERLENVATELAGELHADNPRFDTKRFLAACGVDL